MTSSPAWIAELEAGAPDVVACWRVVGPGLAELRELHRELRARVSDGSAPRILEQQEAVGEALGSILRQLPDRLLRAPGGEEDWNVAQAFAHTTAARRFLASWAALDAGVPSLARPPTVVPSVPGPADASRDQLLTFLVKSRHAIAAAAERIDGHETQRCAVDHPLIGHLRCGEWLLFIGIHDLMHLEQLHDLVAADAGAATDVTG